MIDRQTPDYLPARMLNEFTYCPRLFYYEWVEGVFVDNTETIEGSLRHQKLERKEDALPAADEADSEQRIHSRSVTLSSDEYGLIARLDLIEGEGRRVTPVDYKRGSPRKEADGALGLWDTDRVQLAAQALVLRANGYECDEAVVFYCTTRQRVRLAIDDALIAETLDALLRARQLAEAGRIPPPLEDSPKCPRCSLVGICLPDETRLCDSAVSASSRAGVQLTLFDAGRPPQVASSDEAVERDEVRRLVPARDDLRPLYLNTQGLYVGVSGQVLKVKQRDKLVQEVRLLDISQLNLMGNVQLTTQAIQRLCQEEIPIAYFSQGGWFYGLTQGLGVKNIFLRREQFRWAESPTFCLRLARALVAGKIRNQRTMLMRNHVEPPARSLALLKCYQEDAERAESLDQLLGIEGNAARTYFEQFAGMIKVAARGDSEDSRGGDELLGLETGAASGGRGGGGSDEFRFDFAGRNRRPPRDPVNALLSLAYSVLAKDLTIVCQAVGFDPYLGFFHQPRFGRASLGLDLMEPFRPLIADSAVLSAINTRMVVPEHFQSAGTAVALKPEGRKAFFRAYEQRMDTLATHPLFGYRVNYRRLLEIQARLLARVLTGELVTYPVFTTR
ncbi:MAG: CRISPR-associated endonuclease Cas1 [Pirellulaceae bacterium]|nr:CRISPR-associated endonuclease Cas1 [Pirellulaceae bacterium]